MYDDNDKYYSDYNEWSNMIINYHSAKENTSSMNYVHGNASNNDNYNDIMTTNIISPEDEYIFLLVIGIETCIWLPTAKRKLKCKKSKLKLDIKNRILLCEMESKTNGIKCINFEIDDILSINVGRTNDIIVSEIEDVNKHLCMSINNKPELNITFLSSRERTLFEKVLIKVWSKA